MKMAGKRCKNEHIHYNTHSIKIMTATYSLSDELLLSLSHHHHHHSYAVSLAAKIFQSHTDQILITVFNANYNIDIKI